MTKQVPRHESICVAAGEGPGGFQVTGMIECGQKSKPRKFPRASNKTQNNHWTKKKNIRNWMFVFVSSSYHLKLSYASTTANLKIVLMNPKKSLIKSSHPKKSLPHFPTPKNLGNENFKPQKSFDYPCHLKSEHLLTDVFSFSAANTLNPSIMPYPAKWIEAPPFLSPRKTPYKDV